MAEQWMCVLHGLAGGRARGLFETRDQARAFAERHARAIGVSLMPHEWQDTDDISVLRTQLGEYRVASVQSDRPRDRQHPPNGRL